MNNAFFIFTNHALARMKEQNLPKWKAIKLMQGGTKAKAPGNAICVSNDQWSFIMRQVAYDPRKGSQFLILTVTNRLMGAKAYNQRVIKDYV